MPRHSKPTVLAAAAAGLRSAMYELGHAPAAAHDLSALADVVTCTCTRCAVALSAVVEHDADRVVLEGPGLQLKCAGGSR